MGAARQFLLPRAGVVVYGIHVTNPHREARDQGQNLRDEEPVSNRPTYDGTLIGRTRDRLAWALATFALKYVATPWYAAMLEGSIKLGLKAAREGD